MPEKAIIQINRKHSMFHMMRPMAIYIDGKKITTVNNHDHMKITVFAGTHEVYVTLDPYKTQPLSVVIEANETALLECGVKQGRSGLMAGMFSQEDYLFLREAKVNPISSSPTSEEAS